METAKILLPSVDKDDRPLGAQETSLETQTPFLFVNENSASPAFKLGGRQDIRSHVRKHVAKRFRENHKTGKSARKEEGKVTRYPVIAPQAIADSEYNHTEGCEHKGIPTARNFLKPEVFSASASTSEPPAGSDVDPLLSTSAEDTFSFASAILGGPEFQDDERFFCPTCGSHISSAKRDEIERRGAKAIARRIPNRAIFNYSPVENLASGRVDPFLSYPVEKTTPQLHELIDHAVTYLLPGLMPDDRKNSVNPVSKAWFSTGLEHPLVFHALVFAGSIHLDFLRSSKIFPNSPRALSHKLVVIQKLKEVMSDPQKARRDEVILAILILSSHETEDPSQARRNPFDSPLKSAQWLNIYGNITYVPEHMQAVLNIINMRRGLEKLELHGLAETIAAGDVISSTRNLTKPGLPSLRISEHYMNTLMSWATAYPRLPILDLGHGFRDLQDYCITETAMSVFDAIAALTIAIEHYLEGKPGSLSLAALSRARTAVHHRLLSLPSGTDLEEVPLLEPDLYEAGRLTALIYGVAIVYPIPNSYKVLQQLVQLLKNSLKMCDFEELVAIQPEFLLWMLVIGAIAAFEKTERTWYVTQLARWAGKCGFCDWEKVEDKLLLFLWLKSACESGGRRVWTEVMEKLYTVDFKNTNSARVGRVFDYSARNSW